MGKKSVTKTTRPWRKILYENQGYPDDYVDKSFLEDMRKNLYTRTYEYWNVVRESGVVAQHIYSVCMFVAAFIYMDTGRLCPAILIAFIFISTILGYIINRLLLPSSASKSVSEDLKTIIQFVAVVFLLSPVLKTLTDSISTDTIYCMTVLMLLASLLFHDYGTDAALVSDTVSLNASVFASVCLASRLSTVTHTFAMVVLAMQVFALWPVLQRNIKIYKPDTQVFLTWFLCVLSVGVMSMVSSIAAVAIICTHLCITFLFPYILIQLQQFKNNIHGPWDEATVSPTA